MNEQEARELVMRLVVNIAPMGQMFSIDRLASEFATFAQGATLASVFRVDSDQRALEQFSSFLTMEDLSNQKNTVKGTFVFHNIDAPYDTALAAQRERLPSCTLSTALNADWKSGVEATVSQLRDEVRALQEQVKLLQENGGSNGEPSRSARTKTDRAKSRTSEKSREHEETKRSREEKDGGSDRDRNRERTRERERDRDSEDAKKRTKKKRKKDWCNRCDEPQAPVLRGNCYICGEDTHTADRCPYRPGGCKFCGRYDHTDKECRNEDLTCVFCREPGHSRLRCKDLMHCELCHRPGHSSRHCVVLRKCDKCGNYGHRPQMCKYKGSRRY